MFRNARTASLVACASVLGLAVATGVWRCGADVASVNVSDESAPEATQPSASGSSPSEGGGVRTGAPNNASGSPAPRGTVSPAAAFVDLSPEDAAWTPDQWFVAPSYASPGRYQAIPTSFVFTKSCEARKADLLKADLGTRLRTAFGVDATKPFPDDLRIETLSQFYSFQGRYFQVSMASTGSSPAAFEMSWVAASHPRFEGEVETLSLPGLAPRALLDTPSALSLIAETLKGAKAQGAVEGARAMSVRVQGPAQDSSVVVEAQNGRIVGYSQAGLNCLYARSDKALKCVCGF